jgi:hypothetical protein
MYRFAEVGHYLVNGETGTEFGPGYCEVVGTAIMSMT